MTNKSKVERIKDIGPTFLAFRLGSLWKNKSNNKLYRLRRLTDPKTLQGTLYMWCPVDSDRMFDLVFNEWEAQ